MSEYEAAMQPGEADRKEDAAMAENPEASGTDANMILREHEELENEVEEDFTPSAAEKAKAFVIRKKEQLISKIQAIFADSVATYSAVVSYNKRKLLTPSLHGGVDIAVGSTNEFLTPVDGRIGGCFSQANFGAKTNIRGVLRAVEHLDRPYVDLKARLLKLFTPEPADNCLKLIHSPEPGDRRPIQLM